MPQRNTPARRAMLAARAADQRGRTAGFQPMRRKPANHLGEWNPAGSFQPRPTLKLTPAWMNRWTGEPHQHNAEKERRLG